MLLKGRVAAIYGASGSIGGAVARAFAREGARVFLAGRTAAKLDCVAEHIRAAGGQAETAVLDACDQQAVDTFVDRLVAQAGRIDISFNVIGYGDVQKELLELSVDDFLQPIATAMRTQFVTGKAAARHMTQRGSGLLLTFGGGGPQTAPGLGGFKIALDAIEGLRRQWAIELASRGVRVVTLKTGGIPESLPPNEPERAAIVAGIESSSPAGRAATLADVGSVAAFVASDLGRSLTNTEINISYGALVD